MFFILLGDTNDREKEIMILTASNRRISIMDAITQIIEEMRPYYKEGAVVDYIPILKNIDLRMMSVTMIDRDHRRYEYGDQHYLFSMQSISKVINFIVAAKHLGIENILKYVDLEPTGDPFNSIIRLESSERGKPFNPMINAGAITTASLLPGSTIQEKVESILTFIENVTGKRCEVNEAIYESEKSNSYRNRAISYYLKERGYMQGDPDDALEIYLRLCAIEVSTSVVASLGLLIANDGLHSISKKRMVDLTVIKIVKALMVTCGMYNYSGKYAAFIGIPSKSGVSGGIMCALNSGKIQHMNGPLGIAVFSPSIDEIGNSIVGIRFLRRLSEEYDLSIF